MVILLHVVVVQCLMQKILPCRYLELRSVASTDQLRGPRAASPGRSAANHSLKEPS